MINRMYFYLGLANALAGITTSYTTLKKSKSVVALDSVRFCYQPVAGSDSDSLYNRRDHSDIIKVGTTYYIGYTRMGAPYYAHVGK